jgi:hypothetical protein
VAFYPSGLLIPKKGNFKNSIVVLSPTPSQFYFGLSVFRLLSLSRLSG